MANIQPSQHSLRILMLPWLAHGHISPFLELAKQLTTNNNPSISIHICSTSANLNSIHHDSKSFPNIHLIELQLPSNYNNLPPNLHTTKNLPSHLMPVLKTAFDRSEARFARLLASLSPHLLVYDFLMPWAPSAASSLRIPAVLFLPIASSAAALFCHLHVRPPRERFPFMPNLNLHQPNSTLAESTSGISDGERLLQCINNSTSFIALRTFREIEERYIDYLSTLIGKEVVPVGQLVSPAGHGVGEELEWLSTKGKGTVVFVSVGSEYFMMEREMEELAIGLASCGVHSLWVVRFEGGGDGGRGMGFSWERGLVVEGWAPQREILAHPSVGGFVTHCGWSSAMEGMRQGLAMVAMPMHLDQPSNAELMVELGVAVRVEKEEGSGVFRGEDVARCIREVIVGEKGKDLRRKAEEVAKIMGCKEYEEIEEFKRRIEGIVMVDGND